MRNRDRSQVHSNALASTNDWANGLMVAALKRRFGRFSIIALVQDFTLEGESRSRFMRYSEASTDPEGIALHLAGAFLES